jgi:ankyrin repeat protein
MNFDQNKIDHFMNNNKNKYGNALLLYFINNKLRKNIKKILEYNFKVNEKFLFDLYKLGYDDEIINIISKQEYKNTIDEDGRTLFINVVKDNNKFLFNNFLTFCSLNVNLKDCKDYSALRYSVQNNNYDIFCELICIGAKLLDYDKLFMHAYYNNNIMIMKYILCNIEDKSKIDRSILYDIINIGNYKLLELLVINGIEYFVRITKMREH